MAPESSNTAGIAHEQEFELYHCNESLCSQKARVGFLEKAVPFKLHHIMLCDIAPDCQNLTPEYLAVNPQGKVPTLVHSGKAIYDAHRIVKHVDGLRPASGVRLWPEEPRRQEWAQQWFELGMLDDARPLGATFGTAIPMFALPILTQLLKRQPIGEVTANMTRHPVPQRGQLFLRLHREGMGALPPQAIEGAVVSLCRGLATADDNLAEFGGPWLLGAFSLADITMMACFHRMEDVGLDDLLRDGSVPHLGEYWERLCARPSYSEGITDWHDTGWRSAIEEIRGAGPSPLLADARRCLRAIRNGQETPG